MNQAVKVSKTHLIHFSAKMYSKKISCTSYSKTLHLLFKDSRPAHSAGENLNSNWSLSYVLYSYSKDRKAAGENLYSNCVFNKILVFIACAGDHLDLQFKDFPSYPDIADSAGEKCDSNWPARARSAGVKLDSN